MATPTLTLAQARSRLTFLTGQLSGIATSMRQALARKDGATLETLRTLFKKLVAEAATLRQQVSASEMPAEFLQSLAKFSDDVGSVGRSLGVAAQGIGSAFKNLPLIVGSVAVIAVVLAVIYFGGRRPASA